MRVAGDSTTGNLTRAEYLLFQELIHRASGLDLEERDWTPLRAALCQRVAAVGSSSFGEYYEQVRSPGGADELGRLVELLTVHETSFFRNLAHFDLLTQRIIPDLVQKRSTTRTLRFWSAGCATGQEAYSIAIALLESVPSLDRWRVEVLATDISRRALEQAEKGVYPERALRNVDPRLLDQYFEPWDGGYRVRDRVRRLVRFEYLNLVKEPFPLAALSPFDVIFCENVTIYFKIESTRRVIRNFYEALLEGGYLFLGYSETLWQISNDFVLRELDSAFFYQKLSESRATTEAPPSVPAIPSVQESPPHRSGPSRAAHRARGRWMSTPRLPKRVYTLEEAASLYEARRFEEALLAVEGLLSAEPGNASAHLLAAKLRADREEVGPALRHCRRALDANSLLEEGHYLMGVLLLRSGDSPAAADSLSRVIYLNPVGHRSALAHFHLAGLRTDVEDWEGAGREYRSALRLLERLPKDELVEEFSADFLARVCRRRLQELGREG